jgi:DNA-binding NarL/FixJ family response regulator
MTGASKKSPGQARKSSALIADDHGLYRVGLRLLLEDQLGFEDVIETGGFDEALDRLADTPSIKLALFDLSMPGMGGPSSLAVVRANYPELRVAVISGLEDRANVTETLSHGLNGFIPKSLSDEEIVAALKEVMAGRVFTPRVTAARSVVPAAAPAAVDTKGAATSAMEGLTPRQRDVLAGIVRGLANKEIARELDIAEGTVKIHLAALFSHFDVRNRTELATRAQRLLGG